MPPRFSLLLLNNDQDPIFPPASGQTVAPDRNIEDFEEFISRTQNLAQATRRTAPHIEDQPNNPESTAATVQHDIRRGNVASPPRPPLAALSIDSPEFGNWRQLSAGHESSNLFDYPETTTPNESWAPLAIGHGIPPTSTASQVNVPVGSEDQMASIHQISASNYAATMEVHTSRTSMGSRNGIAQTSPPTSDDAIIQRPLAPTPAISTRSQEIQREAARLRSQQHEGLAQETARIRREHYEQATRHRFPTFAMFESPPSHRSRDLPAIRPMMPSANLRSADNAHAESQLATTTPTLARAQETNQRNAGMRTRHEANRRQASAFENSDIPSTHENQTPSVSRAGIPSERTRRRIFTQGQSQQPSRPRLQHPAFSSSANHPSHGTPALPTSIPIVSPLQHSTSGNTANPTSHGAPVFPTFRLVDPPLQHPASSSPANPPSHGPLALAGYRPVVYPSSMSPEVVSPLPRLSSPLLYPNPEVTTPHDSQPPPAPRRLTRPSLRVTPENASQNRNQRQTARIYPYPNLANLNSPPPNASQAPFPPATRQDDPQTNTQASEALERLTRDIDAHHPITALRHRIANGLTNPNLLSSADAQAAFMSEMRRIQATGVPLNWLDPPSSRGNLPTYLGHRLPKADYRLGYAPSQLTAFVASLPQVPLSELDAQSKDCPCCYCAYEVEVNVDYGTPETAVRLPCAYGKCVLGKRCLGVHLGITPAGTCPLCRRQLEIVKGRAGKAGVGGQGAVPGRDESAAAAAVGASLQTWREMAGDLALRRTYEGRGFTEEADDDDEGFDEEMSDL